MSTKAMQRQKTFSNGHDLRTQIVYSAATHYFTVSPFHRSQLFSLPTSQYDANGANYGGSRRLQAAAKVNRNGLRPRTKKKVDT